MRTTITQLFLAIALLGTPCLSPRAIAQPSPTDSQTLSNGEWTIVIGNIDSWSGVNGTGNLTYRGCDAKQRCIDLTGGTVTCRDGICKMAWRNGEYSYVIEQPMENPDRPAEPGAGTVLIVRQGEKVILRATNFSSR